MKINKKIGFTPNACQMVSNYSNKFNANKIKPEDVYVVWLCKTLQNQKALLSTNIPDGRYYEVTYNGDNDEYYFDSYVREKNQLVK